MITQERIRWERKRKRMCWWCFRVKITLYVQPWITGPRSMEILTSSLPFYWLHLESCHGWRYFRGYTKCQASREKKNGAMSEAEGTRKQLGIRIELVFKANLLESGIWPCKWYTEHERRKCPKSSKHARTTGKWITAKTMLENTCHESLLTKCSSVHKGCGLHYAFMHAKSRDFSTTFYNDVKQWWWKRVTKTKALQFMGKYCAGR